MMRQQHQFISSHLRRVNIRQYDYRHSAVCHRQLQDHVHRHMTCCQIPVQQIILFDPILHRNHLVYLHRLTCHQLSILVNITHAIGYRIRLICHQIAYQVILCILHAIGHRDRFACSN